MVYLYFNLLLLISSVVLAYEKFYQFPQQNFGFQLRQPDTLRYHSSFGNQDGYDLKHSATGHDTTHYGQGSWWDGFRKGWEDGMKYVKNGGKSLTTQGLAGGHSHQQISLMNFGSPSMGGGGGGGPTAHGMGGGRM